MKKEMPKESKTNSVLEAIKLSIQPYMAELKQTPFKTLEKGNINIRVGLN